MKSIKHKFFLLLLFVTLTSDTFSDLPKGISYTHLTLKDKTSIHIIDIDPDFFDIISAKAKLKKLETVEAIAKQNNAIGAINGGFFHRDGDYAGFAIGVLKIKEQWHGIPHLPRGAIGWSNSNNHVLFDQLLVNVTNQKYLLVQPQSNPNYTNSKDWDSASYIVGGAPILVRSSEVVTDFSLEKTIPGFLFKNHARTAIGILPNGHFLFCAVDGTRHYFFKNKGMTVPNLALFLKDLGCKDALNLDGGGSSTMFLLGDIVNTPCGDEYDGNGHYVRSVSDAILIVSKEPSINQEEIQMNQDNITPEFLYKIISPKDWQASQLQNHVVNSAIDKDFIHLATKEQLSSVAKKFWQDREYLILKLNCKKLNGRLIYEANPGGTNQYYHLYDGTIPLDAVEDIFNNISEE